MLGVFRMAPWRRGPALLLRRPGVLTALVAASFVAALPAAAAAPFVSSARNATLAHRIADSCSYLVGPTVTRGVAVPSASAISNNFFPEFGPKQIDRFVSDNESALGTQPGFQAPDLTLVSSSMLTDIADPTPATPAKVRLLARDGFEQHVTLVDGPSGEGVWVPDDWAEDTHVKVGSTFNILYKDQFSGTTGTVGLRVSAVYHDLRSSPDQPWWCGDKELYRGPPGAEFGNVAIPPVLLADQTTFLQGVTGQVPFNTPPVMMIVSFPLTDPNLSVEAADSLLPRINRLKASVADKDDQFFGNNPSGITYELGTFVARAKFTGSATIPGIAPITLAGVLIGLLMVAAAAVFWVLRRSRELTILSARGIGAGALGLKAVIEALPALVIGAVAGWAAAVALVREAGPVSLITGGTPRIAAYLAAASLVASAL
ncbi:MAG TPA: hypothetical protein VKB69_05890, partial [Micromonosporaceae bacterium]|nr:hypothetical protein [Micromonosporaceae bacterium]